jgi:hypothetical protein
MKAATKVVDVKAFLAAIPAAVARYWQMVEDLGNATIDIEQGREVIRSIADHIAVRPGEDGVPVAQLAFRNYRPTKAIAANWVLLPSTPTARAEIDTESITERGDVRSAQMRITYTTDAVEMHAEHRVVAHADYELLIFTDYDCTSRGSRDMNLMDRDYPNGLQVIQGIWPLSAIVRASCAYRKPRAPAVLMSCSSPTCRACPARMVTCRR